MSSEIHELVVIGSGPGGYAAAFRASDLGISVTLIEKDSQLGGVCLNRGCIPSKTLLHISKIIDEAESVQKFGITYNSPTIDMKKIQSWKNRVIKKLGGGIKLLAKQRNVNIVQGPANFISDKSVNVSNRLKEKEIHLLENLRYYNEELEDDVEFSKKLSLHGDVYVNDAFGTSHRQHASNSSILKYFNNKAIGCLMDKEINYLSKILDTDISPCVLILGGAKISTKLKMLNHFINRTSNILIGGAMAFTFLKAKGYTVGKSLVEEHMISEAENIIKNCENNNIQLSLPIDFVCSKEFSNTSEYLIKKYTQIDSDYIGLDIGSRTIELYSKILEIAKTVIWNGPMGAFEMSNFSKGTYDIANKLGNLYGKTDFTSIVGGGDTMRAIIDCEIENQYDHISTGGGASLSLLSGDELILYSTWRKYEK